MSTLAKLRSLAEEYTVAEKAKYDSLEPILSGEKLAEVFDDIDAILEKESRKGRTSAVLFFSTQGSHPSLQSVYLPGEPNTVTEVVPAPISEWWNQLNDSAIHKLKIHREDVFHVLIAYIFTEWSKRSDVPVTHKYERYMYRTRVIFDWSLVDNGGESTTKRAKVGEDKEMRLN